MFVLYRYLWAERERLAENERLRNQRRILRDNSNPFNLPEARFIELFRLNKASVFEIEQLLIPHLQRSRYRNAVPPRIKIFTALRFFATGSYQRSIGEDFNLTLSQTAVHRCIHEVTDLMNEHLPPIQIKFPQDRVLGCIDCTHVAILKPVQDEHNFLNRKGYHSLNVQIICDATMKILNINANFPGASHDSFIWRQSQVRNFLLEKHNNGEMRGTWLLGDSGYPLEPFLMVPIHENVQQPQNDGGENFNRSLRQARSIIERCIGLLKMRFRSIMQERRARYDPNFMGKVVNCCACLHNICVERNIPFIEPQVPFPPAPEEYVQQYVNVDNNNNMFLAGQQIRQNIVNNYFAM